MVLYVVRDLLFVSKIREAATASSVPVEAVRDVTALPERARGACLVIVDLALAHAFEALERLAGDPDTAGVPIVGFAGHLRRDLMETARGLGCREVLSKGELAAKLPALVSAAGSRGTGTT